MDINEEHSNCCSRYENIMFYSVLLEIVIMSGSNYANLEEVCLIIDAAKAKLPCPRKRDHNKFVFF